MQIVIKWSLILVLSAGIASSMHAQQSKQKQLLNNQPANSGQQDRAYWSETLYKIVSPVVLNLAAGTLKKNMPIEKAPGYSLTAEQVTYLEAVGRTMAGIAPWLALPDDESGEGRQRKQLRLALLKGISNAVDPSNPDYLNFRTYAQPVVDAAFMAHAFLRAPKALWEPLDSITKRRVVEEFKSLRNRATSI